MHYTYKKKPCLQENTNVLFVKWLWQLLSLSSIRNNRRCKKCFKHWHSAAVGFFESLILVNVWGLQNHHDRSRVFGLFRVLKKIALQQYYAVDIEHIQCSESFDFALYKNLDRELQSFLKREEFETNILLLLQWTYVWIPDVGAIGAAQQCDWNSQTTKIRVYSSL